MELTKQNLLQCIESLGRIFLEFMGEYYGERFVEAPDAQFGKLWISFDFDNLKEIPCSIGLDAGASSYWSEIASMQTLDNLLMQGLIPVSEYLKRLPSGQIADRETLVAIMQAAEQGTKLTVSGGGGGAEPEVDQMPVRGGPGFGSLQRKLVKDGVSGD